MSTYYIVNPSVAKIIKEHIGQQQVVNPNYGVFNPFSLNIITDENMPEKSISGYERVKSVIPDNKYVTMVTDEELSNPPSWTIFFGLVKPIYKYVVYKVDYDFELRKFTYMDRDKVVRSEYVNKASILNDTSKRRLEFFI